jgi:hypothetical protein
VWWEEDEGDDEGDDAQDGKGTQDEVLFDEEDARFDVEI